MAKKVLITTSLFLAILFLLPAKTTIHLQAAVSPDILPKLKGELPSVMEAASADELIPISIVLSHQVSRSEITALAEEKAKLERREVISERLKDLAVRTQRPLINMLENHKLMGHAKRIRPLWLTNVIGVDTTKTIIEEIAKRTDVKYINYNPKRDVFLHTTQSQTSSSINSKQSDREALEDSTTEIECGVEVMRAPEVWDTMGLTGEGAVIAVIDTGVCLYHPDIVNHIWVNPGEDLDHDCAIMDPDDENGVDDDENGFVDDFVGWNFDLGNNNPDDQNSHGSHCAGTVAGDGTQGTKAGMAHGAKIMVVRVGVQFSDEVDVWNGMQYAAENGADAISMSLGWPHNQNPDRATWRANCENTIEMGTAMIIAAGNEGSGNDPDNVRTPGDVPRVITVGATDCNDEYASFTSWGPVTWEDVDPYNDYPYPPGLIKPDVSAPGVNTKSHAFCDGYTTKSGTSMATPHTAGAVALMISADPTLFHDDIKQILEDSSVELGEPGKDNIYGSGRVDAFEAVNEVAGKLTYDSHTINDSDPNYGNADGNIDYGETIRIAVTLRNKEVDLASNVWAILSTANAGVEIIDKVAYFPDISGEGTSESNFPHFTFTCSENCGAVIRFRMVIHHDDGLQSFTGFSIRSGLEVETVFFEDDMESDTGWIVSGTEVENNWVRDDPHGVIDEYNDPIQPEDDATIDPGVNCYITGNPRPKGKFEPRDGDVDGEAIIESPVFDATGASSLALEMHRWFYHLKSGDQDDSYFDVAISNDGGSSYHTLETVEANSNAWTQRTFSFSSVVQPSSQMKIRARVIPAGGVGVPVGEILLEGGIDDVRCFGTHYECESFIQPSAFPPTPLGDTLMVIKEAVLVKLEWQEPPVDASHDAATLYKIYRSDQPDTSFEEIGSATATFFLDLDEMMTESNWYYKVVAENGGGEEAE